MSLDTSHSRDRIDAVEDASADQTSLVTLAIPPNESLDAVHNRIEHDHAESEYGDSGPTNQYLQNALEELRRLLQDYDETPENGLVVYAGIVDDELVEYVFDDLPAPVDEFVYDHSNEFNVEPLETTTAADRGATYGLLVVERGGAILGRLEGEEIVPIKSLENEVAEETPSLDSAPEEAEGEALEERQAEWKEGFFDDVADAAERAFLGEDPVDELLIGGTEITVDEFTNDDRLDHRLRDRTAGTFSVEYASEQGLRQLVDRAEDYLSEAEDRPARETLDQLFDALESDDEAAVYGREGVEKALEFDAVETLLVSEALPVEETQDLIEQANEIEADYVLIPTDIRRGEQFEEGFEGLGALLRFQIE